ncbi:aldo/keto reductase [Candidatus Latescibacterota bacterium]
MKRFTRREFILNGSVAGTILTAAGCSPRSFSRPGSASGIKYRQLGSTGYQVSEVGLGAMNTRDPELISAAVDAGINYIDTAHGYMNGLNEEVVGEGITGVRDKVFLTTKLSVSNRESGNVLPMLETSLKRLKTDHVDLLLHHGVSTQEEMANDNLKNQFEEAKRKGMARFVGISTHAPETMLDHVIASNFWEAVLVTYNYLSPPEVTDAIKRTREAGIAIIAMKNLLNMNAPHGSGGHSALEDIRAENIPGTTPEQALIKWALNNPYVDTTIPGMTSFEHLESDLAVMNLEFTFDTEKLLQGYIERFHGRYCHGFLGCNGCEGQCPRGVKVSEINRCLGYAYGYQNLELAQENYRYLPRNNRVDRCDDCSECIVKCKHGINLTEQIVRARALFC